MYYGIRTTRFVMASGMIKKGVPAPNLGTGAPFGVIGGETPLLLKLDTSADFDLPGIKGTGRSAKVAIERIRRIPFVEAYWGTAGIVGINLVLSECQVSANSI